MSRAYLVMRLMVVRGIPRFREVRIYSQQASAMTVHIVDEFYVDIISMEGDNYEEAEERLITWIHSPSFPYQWVKQFIRGPKSHVLDCIRSDMALKDAIEEENNALNIVLEHMGDYSCG